MGNSVESAVASWARWQCFIWTAAQVIQPSSSDDIETCARTQHCCHSSLSCSALPQRLQRESLYIPGAWSCGRLTRKSELPRSEEGWSWTESPARSGQLLAIIRSSSFHNGTITPTWRVPRWVEERHSGGLGSGFKPPRLWIRARASSLDRNRQ